MEKVYFEDKVYQQEDFTITPLLTGEYENCHFINCNFSNGNLSGYNFSDCEFNGCNLSLADITKTGFQDVRFIGCKLLGLQFNRCSDFRFTVTFNNCLLNLSSFYQRKIKKIQFLHSSLHEVDFTETDVSGAVFDNCDLAGAMFEQSVLEKADFRSSYNYSVDPETNKIKKARFSWPGVAGLLSKYDISIE